jgi:hypothetical protein
MCGEANIPVRSCKTRRVNLEDVNADKQNLLLPRMPTILRHESYYGAWRGEYRQVVSFSLWCVRTFLWALMRSSSLSGFDAFESTFGLDAFGSFFSACWACLTKFFSLHSQYFEWEITQMRAVNPHPFKQTNELWQAGCIRLAKTSLNTTAIFLQSDGERMQRVIWISACKE